MRILHVASEVSPWAQTGGLADVVGALPGAQKRVAGSMLTVATACPLYREVAVRARAAGATLRNTRVTVHTILGGRRLVGSWKVLRRRGSAPLFLLDCPELYDRDGLYADEHHVDHPDNALRFAFLGRAAVESAAALLDGPPDVLHAHDWQASIALAYLRLSGPSELAATRGVLTIHNLAYQGVFHKMLLPELGLPWSAFVLEQMEYFDQLSFLKGGIAFADAVTTVSPTYAREVMTLARGCGLDDFLRHHAPGLVGIENGIDVRQWDPARDPHLAAPFDAKDAAGKTRCRDELAREAGLPCTPDELLLGVVSRFAEQKGLDLVADLVPSLKNIGARLVVLGSGQPDLVARFRRLARGFSDRLTVRIGFDVPLSRRIYAGADAVLVPSRFEPCGLAQLYAMRYGAIPVVHAVGGLRDTVLDPGDEGLAHGEGTGFTFSRPTTSALHHAVRRAARLHRRDPDGWQTLVQTAMRRDSSWRRSARTHLALYEDLVQGQATPP